jgi:ribonuclease-3
MVQESGPDHQKSFRAVARIGAQTYGEGEGRSKKEAEQQAAEAAWTAISERLSAGSFAGQADAGQLDGGESARSDAAGFVTAGSGSGAAVSEADRFEADRSQTAGSGTDRSETAESADTGGRGRR